VLIGEVPQRREHRPHIPVLWVSILPAPMYAVIGSMMTSATSPTSCTFSATRGFLLQLEGAWIAALGVRAGEHINAPHVGARCVRPGADRIGEPVLGGEEEDPPMRRQAGAVRPDLAQWSRGPVRRGRC
jgi:hypothetical protein